MSILLYFFYFFGIVIYSLFSNLKKENRNIKYKLFIIINKKRQAVTKKKKLYFLSSTKHIFLSMFPKQTFCSAPPHTNNSKRTSKYLTLPKGLKKIAWHSRFSYKYKQTNKQRKKDLCTRHAVRQPPVKN